MYSFSHKFNTKFYTLAFLELCISSVKVTKLDRDAGSGTSLQEITFWLNLERALQKIAQKRESEEVTLTLEALKYGKRFHATVSLDADTGYFLC